ncbi:MULTISPECIES: hypothetical protein [unclassified Yoonia]|uniref:hypothetical protein n=1 Tax=unclassified Yoonia TaxID=2629118 RepID=UPI002AFE21B3|nr:MULTISPECIES: hypothetical protein [unclassified Yoonia]
MNDEKAVDRGTALVIRRVKFLVRRGSAPLRKKAATRTLSAMCHTGKCDGVVTAAEAALIRDAAHQLTGWTFAASDILQLSDRITTNLTAHDFIAFGHGLRDHEKDVMMGGVLRVAIRHGRISQATYEFITGLAYGIGMPGPDVRRALDLAIADLDRQG